ncbi:MAG: hypothetical protein QXZ68_02330 [Candidatus Bathyarchaeia archaeon]
MRGEKSILIVVAILLLLLATILSAWIYRATKAYGGAELTGYVYDYGLDTDGDALYNYLVVEVGVNVYTAGKYLLDVYGLCGEYGYVWTYAFNKTYLESGSQKINIRFVGAAIRNAEINVTKLVDISLYDENHYCIDYRPELNLTKTYNYTEFDEAARLMGTISDVGVDTDGDGLFNYLNVSVEVYVVEDGLYEVYVGGLYNSSYDYVSVYGYVTAFLTAGTCWLNVSLDGLSIRASQVTDITMVGYIELLLVDELTYTLYRIDSIYSIPLSRSYNYTDFEYYALLTGKIKDEGVDTDNDGLFNYLRVGIEIEVAEEGDYYVCVNGLSEGEGGRDLWVYTYTQAHLDVGIHTIYFEYYGPMLAYAHFSPQSLREIYLYKVSAGTWIYLDYMSSAPLSKRYNYTLFDAPSEDMQISFTVYPNGIVVLDGLLNYTHMYPQNTGPLINASVSFAATGSTTAGSLTGVLLLPKDAFQWPFNSTTALLKSKMQNGLSNTTLALTMLMPPAADGTYPFNSSDFMLTCRYGNGMLNFNLHGETRLPALLRSMFPLNATDITVKADFENGEFAGNITLYLVPFIPGLNIVVDFNGNKTELRLTDHINITYGDYPPPIGKIDSATIEGLLAYLNSILPGPNGLIANMTNGLIICVQLNTAKVEWPDGKGAEVRYNATLQGNFTMLFAMLLNQVTYGGNPQYEQFSYAILDSVFSSVGKASLTLDYYYTLGQATADITASCNIAKLWENALEKVPSTIPYYTVQITAYLKILNATAYAIKDFRLDMQYSGDAQKLALNALMQVDGAQLEEDITPLLPETAPNEQLRQILEKYLSVKYCNLTLYDATINYTNGRAEFAATLALQGDFKAELNHLKRFYIDYWNATNPWHIPWPLRMLSETIIDANNFSAEIGLGRDWMLLKFNGLILQPPIDTVNHVKFKLYKFFNMTSYDPYEPPREFQKLKITVSGAFNGTHTTLLYAPDSVPPPDFVSTDFRTMIWENVSISSLKDLEFRIAYQQVIDYAGTHNIVIFTNSTMSNFNFNPSLKSISFNVTGQTGTGFCQVAIPRTLLYAEPSAWIVKIDGQILNYPSDYNVTENDDYVFVTLNYTHSTHKIEIIGTWVIPEFNTHLILIMLAILTLTMAFIFHERKSR